MFSAIAQVCIAFTGTTAVFLTQCRPTWARYACLFGMAGEPFWFYSCIHAGQWGIFCLAFLYTFAWGKGIYTHWVLPYLAIRRATRYCHTPPGLRCHKIHRHDWIL